jgi:RND family efflux transporter MFP subunit
MDTRSSNAMIVCVALGCGVFAAPAGAQDASPSSSALTVEIVRPEVRQWPETVSASGWLQPWQEAVVSSEVGGLKTIDVRVDVGSTVKRGDLLAELDAASVLADISKQEAAIATAEANLDEANANVDRAHTLGTSGALSGQTITQYLIAQRTAQASLASEKAGLKSEQIKLQQTKIVAPDDGVISSRSATLGAVVSSGSEMFRLVRQARIEWQAEVPAQYLSAIKPGQTATLSLSDGSRVTGTVRLLSPTVVQQTGRSIVFVALPSKTAKSGQFANGRIEISISPAMVVPQTAIVQRDGSNYVFIMTDAAHVERHLVHVARRQDDSAEVVDGLSADARVVKAGGAFLSDGATVRVVGTAEVSR